MNYETALKLATEKHKGQFRKDGKPYITHPLAVAENFTEEKYKIVAILHDIVEDTDVTIHDLQHKYKFSKETCIAVSAITKRKGQTYLDFILQVKRNAIAVEVKLADLEHNLSDLGKGNLREKYLMAKYILENCYDD
jgi:(p)ppGpp synthase/HD superfamily hydrolase